MTTAPHLSVQDVADQLGVARDTVRDWADAGKLACIRTPGGWRRFAQSDVDAFLAAMADRQADVVNGGEA